MRRIVETKLIMILYIVDVTCLAIRNVDDEEALNYIGAGKTLRRDMGPVAL